MKELALSAEKFRTLMKYDPETGIFTWIVKPGRGLPAGMVAGHKHSSGRLVIIIARKLYYGHRLAWLYMHGHWPAGVIDHINGDNSDNRILNLRDVSQSQNMQNRRKAHVDSSSGLAGAYQRKRDKSWYSEIRSAGGGERRYLGVFATKEEAHEAFLAAKRKLHPFSTV